ncbi:threonine/homoserine efflux transporter RhtA [Jatrophihabitans sp. GAS493]|uniref:EamA family transporter n=1 Tax=Jatrophihabitans sp. GAS493 TaxID=1907575 RepID=UPI000BB78557|nr:DMT family transporter [Jatrophihabitans sp. GAS493]SOD72047.1 threonine/homoserine efflux transporter RhtA [Jatrophihabitans sp. GAS493]
MPQLLGRSTGLTLAALSAATFGTSGSFGSALIGAGWTPGAAVTARIIIAALVLTPFALRQLHGQWGLLWGARRTIAAFGFIAVAGCQLFYFNALQHLSVGVALLLEYLGTILVVGWLWIAHGHRPQRLTVIGGVTAIAGLVLVLNLASSHHLDPVGVLWGLAAAVGLAVYFVVSSHDGSALPPLVLAWSGMCVGALGLLALDLTGVLPVRAPLVDVTLFSHQVSWIVPVLCLSLLAGAFAYVSGIGAARLLGAKVSSFAGLTEVLFAVIFAWILLGQVPAPIQFVGGALMLAGVTLVRIDELRSPSVDLPEPGDALPQQRDLVTATVTVAAVPAERDRGDE